MTHLKYKGIIGIIGIITDVLVLDFKTIVHSLQRYPKDHISYKLLELLI